MKLVENILFKYGSGKVIRVLYINQITSILYIIDMDSNRWSYPIRKEDFLTAYNNKEIIEVNEDIYSRAVPEEELNEIEKQKRDQAWEIIVFFRNKLADEEHMFIGKYRQKAMKETMAVFNISYNGLKNILIKYFKGSCTKSSLLPNYYRCGAKGKERKVGEKKRGRPRKNGVNAGINIDENIRRMFQTGLNRYFYNERNNSLKMTYELILKDFFTEDIVDENGVKIPLLSNSIPSYHQFLYWYRQLNDRKKEIIKRRGTRVYQQNYRAIIGTSTEDVWQIDSTQMDIYLVSSAEGKRDLIVGRPTLHLVICAYTRCIMGMSISYESLNSYSGEMIALANSMASKKEFCAKYGITIEDSEWPYAVPTKILADRGALNGKQIENAIENLGITIQQTPPFHADYKGIIEQAFNQLNIKFKPFVDGVVVNGSRAKERGEQDYRLKANLTIEEFTKIIIKCILFHNNHHVLTDYVLDENMLEKGVKKIPNEIWKHYENHSKGQLRILPEEVIRTYLLQTDTALITPKGLSYRKLLFAGEYALRNSLFQKARIGGNYRVKICYNPMDLSEVYMFDENGRLHKFTLLEHLTSYSNKGIDEIEVLKKWEQEMDNMNKEKELQEKMKLYTEIEDIVKEAREKTEAERDYSKSKSQRIKGIKENQRNERLLQREKAKKIREMGEILDDSLEEEDEFAMFRDWEGRNDDK
ncbi:Mu transposase C-terminal domain-containing protein [Bacillus sp. MB2021]|uniref:Mu transposase C-terminal domain-containing protein n=1 Tax=Bacillus sp. MB2021 TaxID=1408303 RepID=UPI000689B886|nr:Mu transposase C-terminal domain-containing protein [Bacillus sp. MB2021]